ncbi:unnamed protein product [Adineta steineri]|uniref:NHL repeat containing protein n=1 Tax=Adineta steineri TaxID=433720 RepID=A0A819P7B5_9BILA|nr:unnamed protein product [Adineta steineri]
MVGANPEGIFVDANNNVYVADYTDGKILIWLNGSSTLTRSITSGLNSPLSLFVMDNNDIYVSNAYSGNRVDKWAWNATISVPAMYTCDDCQGIFVDINNMLYCSMFHYHQVIYQSLTQNLNIWSNVAGVSGTVGSTSTLLNSPCGIFVDIYLNLYVADYRNSRIQKFASGQLNGITISTGSITLDLPTSVVLDADGYLFISDFNNDRLIGSGPNGFRCIAACSGSYGSSSSQLSYPNAFMFDSYGNIFVADMSNNRIQKFLFLPNSCNTTTTTTTTSAVATTMTSVTQATTTSTPMSFSNVISYNQPKFGAYAAWNSNGIAFATNGTVGTSPYGIFVDTSNTVYVANKANNQIRVWSSGSTILTRNITSGVTSPYSIFTTITGDIYVDNGYTNNRVDKWALHRNISNSVMQVQGACYDLFIDVNNTLYCSLYTLNQVAIKSLNGNSSMWIVAAGTACNGSTSNSLNNPRGIFVDTNLNLYVADCGNDRVQLFLSRQVTAMTVAGSTATGTISLNCPSDVALDGDGYLFIVDSGNNRIIGSGPNGFRCIIACGSTSGSASTQLSNPSTFSFDSYGNIYVTDQSNNRVQKFMSIPNTTYPLSFNQPNFCPSTTWYTDAITFANTIIAGSYIYGIFVSINNTVYVANRDNTVVYVFLEGSVISSRNITSGSNSPYAVYATLSGDVYVDNGANGQINKRAVNANSSVTIMTVNNGIEGFFIDISNTLYCSITWSHQVVKKWLNDNGTTFTLVAGTGSAGSSATQFNYPSGLYVDAQFNVYVTDCNNNRIQFFPPGQIVGITKVGNGAPGTITLNGPHAITFDANSYMFLIDSNNNRVIGSGPYGFRCLFGCTTTAGSSSSQLNVPRTFGFDSYGNLFVSDQNNNRVQKFIIASNSCSLSYNQPTFCYNALWFSNASTFATSSTIGSFPYGIFINGINTVYVPNRVSNTILTWSQWNNISTTNTYSNLNNPYSLFMSMTGDIYIDNGYSYGRVDKYTFNSSNRVTVMNVNGSCYGLFIDVSNNLYCSLKNHHQVVKLLLNNGTTIPTIAAGNGSAGPLSNMLNSPQGIYVDSNLNLYIADSANNRIQFIQTGQLNGVTIVGNGSSTNFILNYPTGIVLDANGYLFIVDSYNHRIVASSYYGFRCIVGCSGGGSTASKLSFPQSMAFDSYGNIYVTDGNNSRVQQFTLETNNCIFYDYHLKN